MGEFACVHIDADLLPVSDADKKKIREWDVRFQSHDVFCGWHEKIFIGEYLEQEITDEYETNEPDPESPGCNLFETVNRQRIRRIVREYEFHGLTGNINTKEDYEWFRFVAYFDRTGKLEKIERIPNN